MCVGGGIVMEVVGKVVGVAWVECGMELTGALKWLTKTQKIIVFWVMMV